MNLLIPGKSQSQAMDLYVRHHNYTVTHYGWRPMGHVWDKHGNRCVIQFHLIITINNTDYPAYASVQCVYRCGTDGNHRRDGRTVMMRDIDSIFRDNIVNFTIVLFKCYNVWVYFHVTIRAITNFDLFSLNNM
jgi:hypothetical protein